MSVSKTKNLYPLVLIVLCLASTCLSEEQAERQAVKLPALIIESEPLGRSLLEYGSPVTVVNSEELRAKRRSNLGDTVAFEPGVSTSSTGPGSGRPVIRGFAGERVRVLRNGVGTGDVSSLSEDHLVTADPLSIDSIEILRGPETLLYGSNAIGGSVNVIDDLIPEHPIGEELTGEILVQAGNHADDERTGALSLGGQKEKINWRLNSFYRDTADISIPGYAESDLLRESEHSTEHEDVDHDEELEYGRLDNSATLTRGASAGTSYVGDAGFIGIAVNGLSSDYGVPGHDHESVDSTDADSEHADEQGVKIEADELRVDLKGALNTDSSTIEQLKFSLGIFDYRHKELEDTEVASRFKNQGVDSRFEVLHDFALEHTGVSGVTFKHTELEALGEESFIVPTDTTEPGVFTFHKFSLSDRLDYDLGGRVELVQHDPEVLQNRNFVPFSLATGPTWKLMSDQSYLLGLALAYSERAPAASELYASGAHLARQIYEQGDQRLGEESSIGADLTVRKNSGTITGSATSFVQKFKDYINLVADGTEREGLPVYNYQGSAALFWGFELETSTALHDLFRLTGHELYFDLQFDYVRARDTDNSENIPRVQPVRTIARIRQIHKSFNTTLEAVFAEAQTWTAPFELETAGYQLLNVDLEIPVFTEGEQRVALFVNGTNLTDDEARLHTSFIKDLAPMRGRAVLAGIRAIF